MDSILKFFGKYFSVVFHGFHLLILAFKRGIFNEKGLVSMAKSNKDDIVNGILEYKLIESAVKLSSAAKEDAKKKRRAKRASRCKYYPRLRDTRPASHTKSSSMGIYCTGNRHVLCVYFLLLDAGKVRMSAHSTSE